MKIVKNTTGSIIPLKAVGRSVPASGQIEIHKEDYLLWASDDSITEITPYINAGTLVVNDGVSDITVANGMVLARAIDYLKNPDWAFNNRFLSEPERSNGFVSKNIQEAIEESKVAIEGKIAALPSFLNNGVTKNKWLSLDGSFDPSDTLPAITSYDSRFAALTYINKNDNSDIDIEFYKNGTDPGDLVFTWEIRNKRSAYKTNNLSSISFTAGDQIHAFAKEVVAGGTASSVVVNVFVHTTNSVTGEGGSPTLI